MEILVGSTGFVGSNIVRQHHFDNIYHSTNVYDAYGTKPDLLVYAGVRSEMYTANSFPDEDKEHINKTIDNITKISPRRIVLISTVSVYGNNAMGDEESVIDINNLTYYGKHRLELENWVRDQCDDYLIVRLPALFGQGLKKNLIFDYINRIPQKLTPVLFEELSQKSRIIMEEYCYSQKMYHYSGKRRESLMNELERIGFSSLCFTDSRSVFQFYPLENLWVDISNISKFGISCVNLVTEPISAKEIIYELSGKTFDNCLDKTPYNYNITTIHDGIWGSNNGYIMSKRDVCASIKRFVAEER